MVIPFPPPVRAVIYWGFAILGVILSAGSLWFQFTPDGSPEWWDTFAKVSLFVAAAFGITTATNTLPVLDQTAFPAPVRKVVYWIYFVISIIVGAVVIFYEVSGTTPYWLEAVSAIVIFLGGALGFTAASHVVPNPPPSDEAQREVA